MLLNSTTGALAFYARASGVKDELVRKYWG